ncbi:two-component system response regulator BtsR [Ferrimonas gelatinilytica]|uniref:Two-component system response regulator BtsR n=1 Tax=Ferrimonas gelatinilytica TaxID=1255257 RepID=A0ABP9S3V0_9GAMM
MSLKTLIIDDELLARDEMASLLEAHEDIKIVGEAANAIEGMALINQLQPDLVFVDIQMPKITGIEMLAMLDSDRMPYMVFVTAYDEHAISAFENNAFDYLLKPVAPERLAKTLNRVRQAEQPRDLTPLMESVLTHLPCVSGKTLKIVPCDEVEYAFSDLSGVHIATRSGTFHTHLTLKTLEQRSPLMRCHRQYLVSPDSIAEIELQEGGGGEIHTRSGQAIAVSRRYLKAIKQQFGFQ